MSLSDGFTATFGMVAFLALIFFGAVLDAKAAEFLEIRDDRYPDGKFYVQAMSSDGLWLAGDAAQKSASEEPQEPLQPFRWNYRGRMFDYSPGCQNKQSLLVKSVGDNGTIFWSSGCTKAYYYWDRGGEPYAIEPFPGENSLISSMSLDSEVFVGWINRYEDFWTGRKAFLFRLDTGPLLLRLTPPLLFWETRAFAASANAATIVGDGIGRLSESSSETVARAIAWTGPHRLSQFLILPGDTSSFPLAVSANGLCVVGISGQRIFLWRPDDEIVEVGPYADGISSVRPTAVADDCNTIIGKGSIPGSASGAAIWRSGRSWESLQKVAIEEYGLRDELAGWSLNTPTSLSKNGKIISGYGYDSRRRLTGFRMQLE